MKVPLTRDSSSQTSPMSVHPSGCSSSQTALAWVPSTGCSPSGTDCSSVGPPQGYKPCQQTCTGRGSSLHGSTGPGRSLLWHWVPSMGSQLPSGIHPLQCGVPSMGYRWISAPLWTSMDCRRTACLTVVFITSCKGRIPSLTFQAPPPLPPFFTDLGACGVVSLTSSHSSFYPAVSLQRFFVFFFLNILSQRCYHHC